LYSAPIFEIEKDLIELVEVNTLHIPNSIEITRVIFRRNETAIQPDPRASRIDEQVNCVCETIEKFAAVPIPAEAVNNLLPSDLMNTGWETTSLRLERW